MSKDAERRTRSPWTFFALVFALSIPFLLLGAWTGLALGPGIPVAALMFVCPVTAASILSYRERGTAGVTALLKRAFDYKRIRARVWLAPTVLLPPALYVVSYGLVRISGVPLPPLQLPVWAALAMLVAFFVEGTGEELGWSGYAIGPLQRRWGALPGSLVVGVVSSLWHVVPLTQAHRSLVWIAWWCLFSVAFRVLLVWLFNNTGRSVFAASLCHATSNVGWMLIPIYGSFYDPRVHGLVVACAAAVVAIAWGPRTLARRGWSRSWGLGKDPGEEPPDAPAKD